MRIALVLAVVVLAACASEKLASTPPAGVDLGGHWKLNEADSDDPLRLMQSQLAAATTGVGAGGQTGPTAPGGRGGRGGGRAGGGLGPGGPTGPAIPSVTALDEALRWPGKDLTINQSAAGVVAFSVDGTKRVCRSAPAKGGHHRPPGGDDSRGRDAPSRGRGDVPPPICGWEERTLVVRPGDLEEDQPPFEQRFSVSDDGLMLLELVVFKGGRSSGFEASREWDRVPPSTPPGPPPSAPPSVPAPGAAPP